MFLENRNGIGHPRGAFNVIYETNLLKLIDFNFDSFIFGSIDRPFFLADGYGIEPSVNVMFNNGRIKSRQFRIIQGKNIMKFLE